MSPESEVAVPMSEAGRMTGVFFEPKKAFADIGAHPRWLVPMLLVVLASLTYSYLLSQHVGWERVIRKSMENNSRVQQLAPEQREQAVERGARVGAIIGYAGSILFPPIMVALVAAVLLVTSKILGGQLTYRQVFAINSYAGLTGLVFIALSIVVLYLKPPDDFDVQNPLFFNIGAFLDAQSTPKALYSLAGSLDLFVFWRIALLAVGLSAAAKKFPFSKALAAVVLPWILMVVAKMGWAAAFG